MKGKITSFRGGVHTQRNNQMIIMPQGTTTKEEAEKLLGKGVVWKSPANKEIKGKISMTHGAKGAVRVVFEKGMPGQSVNDEVTIQ